MPYQVEPIDQKTVKSMFYNSVDAPTYSHFMKFTDFLVYHHQPWIPDNHKMWGCMELTSIQAYGKKPQES